MKFQKYKKILFLLSLALVISGCTHNKSINDEDKFDSSQNDNIIEELVSSIDSISEKVSQEEKPYITTTTPLEAVSMGNNSFDREKFIQDNFKSAEQDNKQFVIIKFPSGEEEYWRLEYGRWMLKDTEEDAKALFDGNTDLEPIITKEVVSNIDSIEYDDLMTLGRNKGTVVLSKYSCDYYLVETSLGYSLLEWYGGFLQSEGDIIYGDLNSFGFKDISNVAGRDGRVYIDDYMLSRVSAIDKYYEKCD